MIVVVLSSLAWGRKARASAVNAVRATTVRISLRIAVFMGLNCWPLHCKPKTDPKAEIKKAVIKKRESKALPLGALPGKICPREFGGEFYLVLYRSYVTVCLKYLYTSLFARPCGCPGSQNKRFLTI